MNQVTRFCVFSTAMGWVGVAGTPAGLKRIILPRNSREDVIQEVTRGFTELVEDEAFFSDLAERVQSYFVGEPVTLTDPLDLTGLTPFNRSVYQACMTTPRGETISYGELARKVGRPAAARAVGRAMATNPLPIIVPCHRVVGSNGSLTGFGGGLDLKRRMLELEALRPL